MYVFCGRGGGWVKKHRTNKKKKNNKTNKQRTEYNV